MRNPLTVSLIKNSERAYHDFMNYLNDTLPEDTGPDFYNKIFTEFENLPIELQFGYYVAYLNQYKLGDSLLLNDSNTIINAFKQIK